MYSYIYFSKGSSTVHHWYYDENGKKKYEKTNAPLYFYMQDDSGESEYRSIYGQPLKRKDFETYAKMREAREMFKSAGRELFESDIDPENRFILDTYAKVDIKKPVFDIQFIDIEVHSDAGMPDPENAIHPITVITVYSSKHKKFFVFAYKEFDRNFIPEGSDKPLLTDNDVVRIYANEREMLEGYIKFINVSAPDIISGWNSSGWEDKQFISNGFDIPYIINRINVVFDDENACKRLSPIKVVNKYTRKHRSGKERIVYDIVGINLIDYLDLYKKYHQGEQESYKLGYIAKVEINQTKLEFNGSLKELFLNNWQKYVEYNIQDVNLLKILDNKIQFMQMMIGICYNCRCLFEQFSKTTRVLDGAFMSRLCLENIILPDPQPVSDSEEQYVGAYVKEPIPGVYDWVISYDATSLYPSVMMQHNISPETKVMVVDSHSASVIMEALSGGEVDQSELERETVTGMSCKDVLELIKNKNYTIASNGAIYNHDKVGIVAKFVKEWFDNRNKHKKLMEEAQKAGNHDEEKLQKGLQQNYKILINSVYGALGSKYFRLYDRDNAVAVTMTGQDIIKAAQGSVETFFMKKFETSEIGKKLKAKNLSVSPICYGDTDSAYFSAGYILKAINYPHFNDCEKGTKFVEDVIEKLMFKLIENAMNNLTMKRMHCKENKIFFKREMIARKVAFLAKKRYSAWVMKMEKKLIPAGDEHELETKGHEMVKSIIPEKIRDMMREFVLTMLKSGDKKISDALYAEMAQKFKQFKISEICKISNVNNLSQYSDANGDPISGCPGHVRAALGYNKLIKRKGLEEKYELITDGDKVRIVYLRESQTYQMETIAFKETGMPPELNLQSFVDYDIMWEKLFVKPIRPFYEIQKWELPNLDQVDISDLFE